MKLPQDFDPERYSAAHPDVALSGLSPGEHYLRFGKLMGRNPSGKGAAPKAAQPQQHEEALIEPAKPSPTKDVNRSGVSPLLPQPIIDRPIDFDPAEVLPSPAPAKPTDPNGSAFNLETLALGPFANSEARDRICGPLIGYARLFSLEPPAGLGRNGDPLRSGCGLFETGDTRIENAWFADKNLLRLMIKGGAESNSNSSGWAIRAFQSDPDNPAQLNLAGKGVRLPAQGPVFHDIELVHPLMPVVLELSDSAGITQDIALLPFPSLLPGGIHAAELKALQTEANPMDAFWSLSESLLGEALGRPDWPARSVADLSFEGGESQSQLSGDVLGWLSAVFGLPSSSAKTKSGRLCLHLPAGSVPTVGALVSRRLEIDGAPVLSGPFLVAEGSGSRPRWSVALPADRLPNADLPELRRIGRKAGAKRNPKAVPIHLAIATRETQAPLFSEASCPATKRQAAMPGPLSVVFEGSDVGRTEALLAVLREMIGDAGLELLVRLPGPDGPMRDAIDRVCGSSAWAAAPGTDLRELARSARHETLLTISDRVNPSDVHALGAIWDLLNSVQTVASASCVLLGETVIKKQAVLQPASGGLFPAQVSFASSPRLGFAEPDVLQALPDMTYPVVANTLHLTVWRRDALAKLPLPSGPVPATAADIRLGLDLMDAGFRNLCTSKVKARLFGSYMRRDAIDPVGSAYLQPARWEDLLGRVAVIRELF